jgi:hypothetical protein
MSSFGRRRLKCDNNIKTDITEMDYDLDLTDSKWISVPGVSDHDDEFSGSVILYVSFSSSAG